MVKKIICFATSIWVMLSLLCLGGCAQPQRGDGSAQPMKIGVNLSFSGNESFIMLVNSMQEYADELGNVELMVSYSNTDPVKMVDDIENFVNAGCDGIIVQNFDLTAGEAILRQVKEQGIYVITFDQPSEYADRTFMVDNVLLGEAMADMAADWINRTLGGEASIGIIDLSSYPFLKERMDAAVRHVERAAPGAKVVIRADSYTTEAVATVENFLQAYPDLNVVLTFSDTCSLYATEAFNTAANAHGWDTSKRGVFGSDCTRSAAEAIQSGGMFRGTIFINIESNGRQLIDCMLELAQGKQFSEEEKIVYFEMTPVTIENVGNYIN